MATTPIDPSKSDAYAKNTKEQYEALGRFIEAFEMMVERTRSNCVELLERGKSHKELVTIALHHAALNLLRRSETCCRCVSGLRHTGVSRSQALAAKMVAKA
jgi:hypothetical protein